MQPYDPLVVFITTLVGDHLEALGKILFSLSEVLHAPEIGPGSFAVFHAVLHTFIRSHSSTSGRKGWRCEPVCWGAWIICMKLLWNMTTRVPGPAAQASAFVTQLVGID